MIMVCIRNCVSQGGLDQLEPKLNFQMPAEGLEMPVLEELDFKNQFHYHILQSNTISLKSISSLGCSRVHPTFLHNDVTTQDFTGGLVDVLISMLFIPSILCWLLLYYPFDSIHNWIPKCALNSLSKTSIVGARVRSSENCLPQYCRALFKEP